MKSLTGIFLCLLFSNVFSIAGEILVSAGDNSVFLKENSIHSYADKAVQSGILSRKNSVFILQQQISLQKDSVLFFHPNGTIKQLFLSQKTEVGGISFKGESWLFLYPSGKVMAGCLAEPRELPAGKRETLFLDSQISFYPDGSVESGYLANPEEINGIVYRSGRDSFSRIRFYADGTVKQGYLNRDTKIQGRKFKGGFWVSFYPSGNIRGGTLAVNYPVQQGIVLKYGSWVEFYETGGVKSGYLAMAVRTPRKKLKYGEAVEFNRDGNLVF
jgi:hypothetical protein